MSAQAAPPYNVGNIEVSDAVLYIAPKNTPMPDENSALFDATNWIGKTLTAGGATAITLSVTNSAGTQSTASITTFGSETAAALTTALAALSNVGAGKVTVVGPNGGPFVIVFDSSLGSTTLSISASTGGTPTVTGGLWTPPGATEAGWSFSAARQTQNLTIEEQSTPVGVLIVSQDVSVSGTMSEVTSANWQFALNALRTEIAQGVGQAGITDLSLTDDLIHYALCLESKNQLGFPTRLYIPDAVSTGTVTTAFRRAQAQKMIPVTLSSVCATSAIKLRKVNSPAL